MRTAEDSLHARAAAASQLSITISDPRRPDDPLIWVNPAFERVSGYPAAEAVGRNCRFLQDTGTDPDAVARIRTGLAAGRTVAETLRNVRRDGTPWWNRLVISPVLDPDGVATHHVGIQTDVTSIVELERERDAALASAEVARARLELVAQVSETLIQHLDDAGAVRALADLVVPRLATWGFVAVTDERGRIDGLHVAAGDPALAADAAALGQGRASWISLSAAFTAALLSRPGVAAEPFRVDASDLPDGTTPDQVALVQRLGLNEVLVVPLHGRDGVIGVLCLVDGPTRRFTAEEVETATYIGRRAGLGLENARLYVRERSAALTLQQSLLPDIGQVEGLDIAASYLPALHRAEVGGDWFDVLPLPDGAVGLAVGDVVGHDLRAAASMGQLRSVLRSHAWSGAAAGRVIAHLDQLVRGFGMADMSTCVYLRLGPGPDLTYCRAGHPPPLLRLPDGSVTTLDGGLRTPIGVPDVEDDTPEASTAMPHGSVLVLYSDGLVERRDRSLRTGIEQLTATLAGLPTDLTAAGVRDHLVDRLVTPQHQEDDVCLLVVRRP